MKFQFKTTNNESEYEAVITGLQLYKTPETKKVKLKIDSKLVVRQIIGEYECKDANIMLYLARVKEFIAQFQVFTIESLPRSQNA